MKLILKKGQSKKLMGGTSFELDAKVDLTGEEEALVQKYKADKEVLMNKEVVFFGKPLTLSITIGNLISGEIYKCSNIGEILEYEENIIESCKRFKDYIRAMEQFGGEEEIEI